MVDFLKFKNNAIKIANIIVYIYIYIYMIHCNQEVNSNENLNLFHIIIINK